MRQFKEVWEAPIKEANGGYRKQKQLTTCFFSVTVYREEKGEKIKKPFGEQVWNKKYKNEWMMY